MAIKKKHVKRIPGEPVTMEIVRECRECKDCLTLQSHVTVCRAKSPEVVKVVKNYLKGI